MRVFACLVTGSALTSACSVTSVTGDVLSEYAVDHMNPYLLGTRDVGMACATGEAMAAFLMSFERVTLPPHRAAISAMSSAAACAEETAWAEELRSLRSIFLDRPSTARDARIAQKRAHAIAADRYYRAYMAATSAFVEPGGECPRLDKDEELLWLLGLLSAVQAVQHDRASGGLVAIPLDVPSKAAQGAACLNNEQWWGVPDALRAVVWLTIPGQMPTGANPWAQLQGAVALGRSSGVRLSSAIYVQAALTVGDKQRLMEAIQGFADVGDAPKATRYRLIDALAKRQVMAASDRLWTEAAGHRTPIGGLGTFWAPPKPTSNDGDDLLQDLEM